MKSCDNWLAERFAHVELHPEQMHHYQQTAKQFVLDNPFCFLLMDMGLGKCISTASAVDVLLSDIDSDDKVLIIAPLKVATMTWPTELRLWSHLCKYDFELLRERDDDPALKEARDKARAQAMKDAEFWELPRGQTMKFVNHQMQKAETEARRKIREEKALSKAPIHIISREQVEWLSYFFREKWPYTIVIIDEATSFKDHNSGRFDALKKVRASGDLIKRMVLLTASIAAEGYMGLFALTYLLDKGKRFGTGITRYRDKYFTFNKWSQQYKLRPDAKEEITEKIADLCLIMKQDDYLPRERATIVERRIVLSETQMALYKRMEKDFLVELPGGEVIEAVTAAALAAKLLQMASGSLYETILQEDFDTGDFNAIKKVHDLHDEKIEMLREVVEELDGEPLLVGYHWKSSLAKLKKAFPKAAQMDREGKLVADWNKRKFPIMFIHPQSGGHGLNMQKGGHNLAYYDIPWSKELFDQLIGRLDRQGQKHPVLVQLLMATGTYDEIVVKNQRDKTATEEDFLDRVRRHIRKRRKQLGLQ